MTRSRTIAAVAVAASALALTLAPTAAAAPTRARSKLVVHVTHHHVHAAHAIAPGIVHVGNYGHDPVIIAQPKNGLRPSRAAVAREVGNGPARPLLRRYRVMTLAQPRSGSWVELNRGVVYLVDVGNERVTAAQVREVVVRGHRVNAPVPSGASVVVSRHGHLFLPKRLAARGYARFANHTSSISDVYLLRVARGVSDKALRELVAHPSLRRLDAVLGLGLAFPSFALVGQHTAVTTRLRSRPGRFVAFVLMFSDDQLRLHHGQLRLVHLH